MAILFEKDLDTTKILNAYNNNVVRFYSDSVFPPVNCIISINGSTDIVLYPNPQGKFYFNFKEYITSFINTDNFTDDMLIDLTTPFYYKDWTDKTYLFTEIEFTINFVDESNESVTRDIGWLSSFAQIDNRFLYKNNIPRFLTDSQTINYWAGLPFDVTVFTPFEDVDYIVHQIEDVLVNFNIEATHGVVNRIAISDGDVDTYLFQSQNELGLTVLDRENGSSNDVIIRKNKINCFNGFYIKWINSLGGWNYWYFEDFTKSTQTKDTYEVNNNFNNLEDTLSKTIQAGKLALNKIQTKQEFLSVADRENFMSLFTSAKIYLFIGEWNNVNAVNDWTEISLVPQTFNYENSKNEKITFNLTFELPELDTRTI